MYKIIGFYRNNDAEILDTANNKSEAIRLAEEYELAFGNEWIINIEKINLKNKNNYENKSK